tara:strand:+ start:276 stop:536 length:261 start_codon:yes stop_codon:yes gene_type:complete
VGHGSDSGTIAINDYFCFTQVDLHVFIVVLVAHSLKADFQTVLARAVIVLPIFRVEVKQNIHVASRHGFAMGLHSRQNLRLDALVL